MVTYVLIAVVPILLILTLAGLGGYMLAGQVAVYLVRSELDRRVASLQPLRNADCTPTRRPSGGRCARPARSMRAFSRHLFLIDDQWSTLRWPEQCRPSMRPRSCR